jgi:hypothetical protein
MHAPAPVWLDLLVGALTALLLALPALRAERIGREAARLQRTQGQDADRAIARLRERTIGDLEREARRWRPWHPWALWTGVALLVGYPLARAFGLV